MSETYGFYLNVMSSQNDLVWILAYLLLSMMASWSILLKDRDSFYKASWLAIVWFSPFVGVLLYMSLGINRIERKGQKIRSQKMFISDLNSYREQQSEQSLVADLELQAMQHASKDFMSAMYKATDCPLVEAHVIEAYQGGNKAYASMLECIEKAAVSVHLQSYIFDRGTAGDRFIAALLRAKQRGVEVRVLVDAIGAKYSFPSSYSQMKKLGLNCFKFLPNRLTGGLAFINLRNHRKILTIDSCIAFTGGMNIRDSHLQLGSNESFTDDLHFKLTGPIAERLDSIFMEDWCFSGGIVSSSWLLKHADIVVPADSSKSIVCRVIPDGPDLRAQKINLTNLLGISFAKSSIEILTPYFVPDKTTLDALCIAAMKGVRVRILVPKKGNIPFVNWAMIPQFSSLIKHGCQVFLSDFMFDHSKLMIVDKAWSCIGTANWDMRSYRLNFEVNVEVYNLEFAQTMHQIFQDKILRSKQLTMTDITSRSRVFNLRDQIFSLVSPYL